jgi:formylglycine-generating enzyme required for sulfatase activity
LTQEDTTELLERLKRLLAEDPTLAARLAAITGDGNVVGDHNVATVNKLSAGDYAIQIGQLHLTLSSDQLRSLPVSAYTVSPLPAAPTGLPRQLKVFLCHASGDKPAVRNLYHRLRVSGFDPWLDEENLLPGQDWQLEILKAVRSSDAVVICLSSRAITKAGYVQKEIKYALDVADEQPEGAIFLIPLRLEECEVPERLRRWQWVDFYQEKGYERLLRALRARAESLGLGTHLFEPEMVLIPAGEFLMGSDPAKDKDADTDEFPQHTLYLPDYYMARTPLTNAQYAAFVQATGHEPPEHWESGKPPPGKEDHPVVYVSWHDAVAYCKWLSQVTGRLYRLPSEAEWEKAARGTDGRIYPWGNEPPDEGRCNFDNHVGGTNPVGRYLPQGDSPYGCTDMAGNVWEWTRRLFRGYPYDPSDGRENLEAEGFRVVRGGAFGDGARVVRCACRNGYYPDYRGRNVGFRLVGSPVHL